MGESGESMPDIDSCIMLARLYDVTLDDLVAYAKYPNKRREPDGKYIFGIVKIDSEGRIVLPKKAMDIFDLEPNNKFVVLGDERQGLALVKLGGFLNFAKEITNIIKEDGINIEEDEE